MSKNETLSASECERLIAAAKTARENAHAAYSNFRVGAGLRATSGRIFGGCNVEKRPSAKANVASRRSPL